MANTKIPIELSSTPSIVDNGDATAITIDSSERVNINKTSATTGHALEIQANTSGQGMGIYGRASDDFSFLGFYENGANTELSSLRSNSGFLGINTGGTQRLRVDSDGLKFGSDTAAANALDDYEEGTYTPVMNSSNLTYSTQLGWYIKVGSHVTVGLYIDINTNGNGSGVAIGDLSLPFAAAMGAGQYATCGSIWCNAWSTATKSDVGILLSGTSAVVTRKSAGQASVATPTHGDLGTGNMLLTISYQTA